MNRSTFQPSVYAAGLAALLVGSSVSLPAQAVSQPDAAQVIREACGDDPNPRCVAELRKVCHRKMTMRCYLSRKQRFDVRRDDAESPEHTDERDDRSIFYDE